MQRSLFILFSCLFVYAAHAQQVKRFSFLHHSTADGLASNEVVFAKQDQDGYMWIGTNNGLQRFDGVRYISFRNRKNDSLSIPDNYVVQILFDKKNNMWIRTSDGKVGIFDRHTFTYHQKKIRIPGQKFFPVENRLLMDDDGNILLLFRTLSYVTWNEKKQEFAADYNFIPLAPDLKILDIEPQPGTKKYWIGTFKGMMIYDRETNKLSYAGHNSGNEWFIEKYGTVLSPWHLMFDSRGRIWFDSWQGGIPLVYAYDLKKKEAVIEKYSLYSVINNYYEVRGFLEQKNGTIWVNGTGVFGRYLEKEKQIQLVYNGYENEQSIAYTIVNGLSEDREENIWISTNLNGLYQFNPSAQFFTNVRQTNRMTGKLGDGSIMSFASTKQGTLLTGAWGDGLYQFDSNYKMIPLNYPGMDQSPFIWSTFISADSNTIWMGAQPGIYAINQVTHSATYHNPAIMQNRTVRQVAEDNHGNLWMGSQSMGLFKCIAKNGVKDFERGVVRFAGIPECAILKILIDKKGNVWAATSAYGLYEIDPATDKVIAHFGSTEPSERKLIGDRTWSLLQYNDTTIVIAAGGIQLINTLHHRIAQTISLPENIPGLVSAMEKDKAGYIWISTTNGIFRLNIDNKIFIHFDRVDGIANDYFTVSASYVLADGRILFGADNQFVVFDPMRVKINEPAPDITITGFKLMNNPLQVDSLLRKERIELAPKDNAITIEFSGLNYNGTYIIKYKLEGLDKEWIRSDQSNQAVYSHLPPGKYTFLVKSEDAEGHPSKNIASMVINVKPPFWRTWWFVGLLVFAIIALLYWLDKQRMQKLRATESIRTRIATSLTEDMSNSLSSINISSELAKTKVDTDTERTKEYIGQISETSNRMVQAMYDMVWSIDPKNDTMLNTIERMKSFAVETESLNDIDIVFDIDATAANLDLDMARRYELLSVFKEAIANSIKHSLAKHVQVSLRLKNSKFFMLIEDDGKGFDASKAALGRGLNDMKRRAEAIHASFYLESEINTGTVVKLEMPV